jgi:hypothetical protein
MLRLAGACTACSCRRYGVFVLTGLSLGVLFFTFRREVTAGLFGAPIGGVGAPSEWRAVGCDAGAFAPGRGRVRRRSVRTRAGATPERSHEGGCDAGVFAPGRVRRRSVRTRVGATPERSHQVAVGCDAGAFAPRRVRRRSVRTKAGAVVARSHSCAISLECGSHACVRQSVPG